MFYRILRRCVLIIRPLLVRMKVVGKEKLTREGGYIITPNHLSALDCVFVALACKRTVHYMAKKELFENKLISWFLKKLQAFSVDRQGADIKAIKHSMTLLKEQKVLGIFPEGTRATDEKLGAFHQGPAMLAIRSQVPIVPVGIYPKFRLFSKIVLVVGDPVEFPQFREGKATQEEIAQATEQLRNITAELMEQAKAYR